MLTSKQRAYLRGLGNPLDTILMVGKGGMSPEILKQADDAITAREIIKGKCLETSRYPPGKRRRRSPRKSEPRWSR